MENRQGVEQHIPVGKPPKIHQGCGIAGEVAVAKHNALGSPGGAGGVEQGGGIVRL